MNWPAYNFSLGGNRACFHSRDSSHGYAGFTVGIMGYFLPEDSPTLTP
jgi:hypothetical protein